MRRSDWVNDADAICESNVESAIARAFVRRPSGRSRPADLIARDVRAVLSRPEVLVRLCSRLWARACAVFRTTAPLGPSCRGRHRFRGVVCGHATSRQPYVGRVAPWRYADPRSARGARRGAVGSCGEHRNGHGESEDAHLCTDVDRRSQSNSHVPLRGTGVASVALTARPIVRAGAPGALPVISRTSPNGCAARTDTIGADFRMWIAFADSPSVASPRRGRTRPELGVVTIRRGWLMRRILKHLSCSG